MLIRATVVSNHRAQGYCNIAPGFAAGRPGSSPGQQGTIIRAQVRDAKFPPPLSTVWVDRRSPSSWILSSSLSARRELLHDDFSSAIDPQAVAGAGMGDLNWNITNLVAYAYGQQTNTSQGVGVLVVSDAITQAIAKDDLCYPITSDPALWFSGSMSSSTLTNTSFACGIAGPYNFINAAASAAGDACAAVQYDSITGSVYLATANGVTTSTLVTPFVPSTSVFFDFDIIVVGGEFAALWINGDGPYVQTNTSVPGTARGGFEPFFRLTPLVAVSKDLRIDWAHAEAVSPIVAPTLLYS